MKLTNACFVALALVTVAAPAASAPGQADTGALIGDALPDLTIARLDGKGALRLRDVGARLVVSFFSRFCRPCFRELPVLHRIVHKVNATRSARDKITLVVIVVDAPPPAALRKQLGGAHWLIDRPGIAAVAFKPRRFPCTYIAKANRIRKINRGYGRGYAVRVEAWLRQVFVTAPRGAAPARD